jgi:hypothetical protein
MGTAPKGKLLPLDILCDIEGKREQLGVQWKTKPSMMGPFRFETSVDYWCLGPLN